MMRRIVKGTQAALRQPPINPALRPGIMFFPQRFTHLGRILEVERAVRGINSPEALANLLSGRKSNVQTDILQKFDAYWKNPGPENPHRGEPFIGSKTEIDTIKVVLEPESTLTFNHLFDSVIQTYEHIDPPSPRGHGFSE